MMSVYVDESKYRGYLLAAVSIETPDLPSARRRMSGLILPGQYRLHMRKENPRRKKQIVAAICGAGITAHIYADRHHRDDLAARSACLQALVNGTAGSDTRLIIEQDDGLVSRDRADLYRYVHQAKPNGAISYQHQRASAELLLGLPDAIAWAWARGGNWRRQARPAVVAVHGV